MFSIKVCKPGGDAQIVGRLPMEISRTILFILQRGATNFANMCRKYDRGSPLVQKGLEIPCQIMVCIRGNVVNHRLLSPYETLLRNLYINPKDEEIMGTFLAITNEPLREAEPSQPKRIIKRQLNEGHSANFSVKINGKTGRSRWKNCCY